MDKPLEQILKYLSEGPASPKELSKRFLLTKREIKALIQDLRAMGYDIRKEEGKYLLGAGVPFEGILRLDLPEQGIFAIVSDTHIGNKKARLDLLHDFYDFVHERGVRYVFHAGDITEGMGVYRGQLNDLSVVGVDNQANHVIEEYPSLEGLVTIFITGNHDLKAWDKEGVDVGKKISDKREDLIYLGQYYGRIVTPQQVKIDLIHPASGSSYAVSYHPQKYIEKIRGGQKPHVLVWGHQHDLLFMFYRNVYLFKAGTFLDQTPFMIRKGLPANIGGWLVEYKFREGEVEWLKAWLRAYYD